jgi:hypothetical protein
MSAPVGMSPVSVDVGAVVDGRDDDASSLVLDSIDHAKVSPAGGVETGQLQMQFTTHAKRAGGQPSVDALNDRRGHLLAQPRKVGRRPSAGERGFSHPGPERPV